MILGHFQKHLLLYGYPKKWFKMDQIGFEKKCYHHPTCFNRLINSLLSSFGSLGMPSMAYSSSKKDLGIDSSPQQGQPQLKIPGNIQRCGNHHSLSILHLCNSYIYIYIPAKPKTQEFLGQSKITGYLDTALEISRAPLKFGFWGKNA